MRPGVFHFTPGIHSLINKVAMVARLRTGPGHQDILATGHSDTQGHRATSISRRHSPRSPQISPVLPSPLTPAPPTVRPWRRPPRPPLLQELHEPGLRPLAVKVHDLVGASLDELDGGEALDLDLLQLVSSAVDLSDDDGRVVGVLLAQLVPHWHQLLAVAAPGRVELDQHVLG